MLARPSVMTTIRARATAPSLAPLVRARSMTCPANVRPWAKGLPPPVGKLRKRLCARAGALVGATNNSAFRPQLATTATCDLFLYDSCSKLIAAPLQADMRWIAILPDASTTRTNNCPAFRMSFFTRTSSFSIQTR